MPDLIITVGESASGKSTWAKNYVAYEDANSIELNRDELRQELSSYPGAPPRGSRKFEGFVIQTQKSRAREAIKSGKSVVISDTNLNNKTQETWRTIAGEHGANFRIELFRTPLSVCIERDARRTGTARVGRAVVERQFLLSKRLELDPNKKVVIVDLDGTLADMRGLRGAFEEHKVHLDRIHENVVQRVQELSVDHIILIVSGRHSTCGDASVAWLQSNNIPFKHIFMRHGWDSRSDTVVKQEILDELLALPGMSKDRIELVIDDRPRVIIGTWLVNELPVQPVYRNEFISINEWTTEHQADCTAEVEKGFGRCSCGAMEDF